MVSLPRPVARPSVHCPLLPRLSLHAWGPDVTRVTPTHCGSDGADGAKEYRIENLSLQGTGRTAQSVEEKEAWAQRVGLMIQTPRLSESTMTHCWANEQGPGRGQSRDHAESHK